MGESLVTEDPRAAGEHLEAAARILEELGARNEYAKALVAQAELRRIEGDAAEARRLLQRAAALFEALGTLDEPRRVQATFAALGTTPPA